MFFGGNSEQKVELGQLDAEVDKLFDKRVERLAGKASKISEEIRQARLEFVSACEEFDRITAKPDLEQERWMNPNFIESQKDTYVVTLKRLFSDEAKSSGSTHYARYSAELSSVDSMMAEMLKVNNRYRAVIYAYPKHLDRFKRAQAHVERLASSLRAELERVKTEFGEYNEIDSHLVKISEFSDEIVASEKWLKEFESGTSQRSEKENTAETETNLASKHKELSVINGKKDDISSRILSLLMPLERAARTYDHSSLKKRKLADIIAHPVQELSPEGAFDEFMKLLEDLKSAVESKKIEVKKPNETLAQISKIKDTNIYEMLDALGLIEKEAQSMEAEIRFFERSLDHERSKRETHETHAKSVGDMKNKIESLKDSLAREKRETEQLVMKYYKKKLEIIA